MKYVCELCGFVYDEAVGDLRNGILPGTVFGELPVYYECPGCGYEKETFSPVRLLKENLKRTQSHGRMLLPK